MTVAELLVDQLDSIRAVTLETFDTFARDERLFQPAPGLNHALWLLGHIAVSEDHLVLNFCAAHPLLPRSYGERFGMGTTPSPDTAAYPSAGEIKAQMARVHEAALTYVRRSDADELNRKPLTWDRLNAHARERFPTRGRTIWFAALHEAMHAGQMALLRRMLGKPARI